MFSGMTVPVFTKSSSKNVPGRIHIFSIACVRLVNLLEMDRTRDIIFELSKNLINIYFPEDI